LPNDLQIHMHT